MKNSYLVALCFCLLISLVSCIHSIDYIHGSDETVSLVNPTTDFDAVSVSNKCEAVFYEADTFAIEVTINKNIEPHLNIQKYGHHMRIFLDEGYHYRNLTFKVAIYLPVLREVTASGASKINLSGFTNDQRLTVNLSGASSLSGSIYCGDFNLVSSGASTVTLQGGAQNIGCKSSGASRIHFDHFPCNDLYLDLSGASKMYARPGGIISGELSGASALYYYGNPTLGSIHISGASVLKRYGREK